MAPNANKHDDRTVARNGTRILKPAIGLDRLEKNDEGKYDKKSNTVLTPVMPIVLPMRSQCPTLVT